jgi:hypothetical protein
MPATSRWGPGERKVDARAVQVGPGERKVDARAVKVGPGEGTLYPGKGRVSAVEGTVTPPSPSTNVPLPLPVPEQSPATPFAPRAQLALGPLRDARRPAQRKSVARHRIPHGDPARDPRAGSRPLDLQADEAQDGAVYGIPEP